MKCKGVAAAQLRFQVAEPNSFQQVKLECGTAKDCLQKDKHGGLPDFFSYVVCNLAYEEI